MEKKTGTRKIHKIILAPIFFGAGMLLHTIYWIGDIVAYQILFNKPKNKKELKNDIQN
ncbi:MAG: hypothetical protein OEX08_01000 [Candidatus Nomurabacteria bacterium]|nr:hypothetical protein [Candidatus Nomurabacteria bacterium]